VRELRARRGHSQETLGFAAGLHRNYVGAIERGEINPTFKVMLKVATGLSIDLAELVAVYRRQLRETPAPRRRRRRRPAPEAGGRDEPAT
jgi:transcriptional regulator with XRE-family HTH domain